MVDDVLGSVGPKGFVERDAVERLRNDAEVYRRTLGREGARGESGANHT